MSVNIRGHEFYSASEVDAMTPSGTVDSQWETYDFPCPSGASIGWSANRFHVNKITGLVVGWVALSGMNRMSSVSIGTVADLGIHSGMDIKYTGNFVYGNTNSSKATTSYNVLYKELNGIWDTNGLLKLEGEPMTSTSDLQKCSDFIEHYTHIGNKYGKITTEDVKPPIYFREGAFYDTNTADLISGRAWLKFKITAPSGYSSSSYVTWYKNLWSGEIIMQYSLNPSTTSPASITMPSRCAVLEGRNFYTDIRYVTVSGKTPSYRQVCWMRLNNVTLSFFAENATWMTGSLYYPGNPEIRTHNLSYETISGLYLPEANEAIPSAQSSKWPSSAATSTYEDVTLDSMWNTSYYISRSGIESWTWRSARTGMVFSYFDMNIKGTSLPDSVSTPIMAPWMQNFLPSYRYNKTSGKVQLIYFAGASYINTRASTTDTAASNEFTCNLCFYSGKSLGTAETNTSSVSYNVLHWGTTGNLKAVAGNLACFTGQFLGNTPNNIVK